MRTDAPASSLFERPETMPAAEEMDISDLKLRQLQPSQFYISEKKLRDVEEWFDPCDLSSFEPIPVKYLDGRPVITDGHTRAVAALRAGLVYAPLVPDGDELDWEMYIECVEACLERGVISPEDLLDRVIPESEYRDRWDRWCDDMQEKAIGSKRLRACSGGADGTGSSGEKGPPEPGRSIP